MNTIFISLNDNGIVFETNGNAKTISQKKVSALFDRLAQEKISRYHQNKNNNSALLTLGNTRCRIYDYNKISKLDAFQSLNKKINTYKITHLISTIGGKKMLVCGSLIGSIALSSVLINQPNSANTLGDDSITLETYELDVSKITGTIELEDDLDNDNAIYNNIAEVKEEIKKEKIEEDDDIDPLSYVVDDDIDPLSYVTYDDIEPLPNVQPEQETVNTITTPSIDIDNLKPSNSNVKDVNFDDLKTFTTYNEYIEFAANLYGVDIDKAYELVKANYQNFTSPGKVVNADYAQEIDRMKDLVTRGYINGDLNVIGIFLTIKDYALDYLDLGNKPPIKSDKNQEERERDIINIAKYIYGVDDTYLLNLLIATTRVESANFTSAATINKNNIGGNMSTKGTFEHPILNTYHTAELGQESFVRNLLNCLGKSLVAHGYTKDLTIPYILKDKLCPHSPDHWAEVITEKVQTVIDSGVVEMYTSTNAKRS